MDMPDRSNLPQAREGLNAGNAAFHVVPDNVQGGWNVYAAHKPQEPQRHFQSKQEAIAFAERLSGMEGTGFIVESHEAPSMGR